MCDLIDLTSPDKKDLLGTKLASPLIPIPTDTGSNNNNIRKNGSNSLITEKRESLDNNPFDTALYKITEYIQKKDDPFEVILEKAQREEYNDKPVRRCSDDITDYSNNKPKVHYQKLKRHRTLDEFLLNTMIKKKDTIDIKASNENIGINVKNYNILNNDRKSDDIIPTICIQNMDSSILNQSGMNDTLFEGKEEQNKHVKSTLGNMKKEVEILSETLKIPKFRRSLSQGDTISPRKSQYLSRISLVDVPKIGSINGSNEQQNSMEFLNEGFLKTHSSGSSVFSSLSNVSSIPKLNSVSSTVSGYNSSSVVVSDDTMNRSFLGSCSSDKSERLMRTSTSNVSAKNTISDLTERFNKLKAKISEIRAPENIVNNKDDSTCTPLSTIKGCASLQGNTEKSDVNEKLIDVDLFTSDSKSNNEYSNGSISDTSTDSVFVEGNQINKLIRKQAKCLARTFEELASKTSSGSSVDDLITNNPSWISELVPAFDDEISVENLIELPASPERNIAKPEEPKVVEHKDNDSLKNKENPRDLEMELVESTEKHLAAATLLLDLKRIIKTENNVEANKLVENLEKTLGVNCDNNTKLLAAYLNATNNLAKSPKKSSSNLEIIKNVRENAMEHSQEDNLTGSSIGSIKESVSFEYVNFNDADVNKCINNQKNLSNVNIESNSDMDGEIENIKEIKERNSETVSEEKSSLKMENNTLISEKLVIELLANIGKLIYGQTEEHPTQDILINLRKALQTSKNCNIDNDTESNNAHIEIQQTPKKSTFKFENRSKSFGTLQSASRLSLNLESKKQPINKNVIRRSISVSQTLPMRNKSSSSMSTSKSTSQLNDVTKRFSGDADFVSSLSNKKAVKSKSELQTDTRMKAVGVLDLQKEKPSAISTVKNKLKKKIGTDIVNKKGPLKAILPMGIMQRKETLNKKVTSSTGSITPPQSHKIISSTPNPTNNDSISKKSRSSKPVASSTPDTQDVRKVQSKVITSPKKRNFSYDISPVTTRVSVNDNKTINNSSRSRLPSPKRTTPKLSKETGIPRSQTPPIRDRLHSSFEFNSNERLHVSPQSRTCKTSKLQKGSPISFKKIETQQSPLKDSNKITYKVKPMNLISKIRRHSFGTNAMEKENNYI